MSILSSALKKIGKSPITRAIGKGIDFGSDFLPPGFRDIGNLSGKLLQGKNLKLAALGTAGDYLGGRIAKGIGGKLQGIGKSAAIAGGATPVDLMAKYGDPSVLTAGMKNVAGAGPSRFGGISDALGSGVSSALGGIQSTDQQYGFGGNKGVDPNQSWQSKLAGGIGNFLPKNPDGSYNIGGLLKGAAGIALPAAGAIQASKKAAEADKYRKKQIGLAEDQWKAGAPLRTMGLAGLTDPRMADISSLLNRPRPNYTPVAP